MLVAAAEVGALAAASSGVLWIGARRGARRHGRELGPVPAGVVTASAVAGVLAVALPTGSRPAAVAVAASALAVSVVTDLRHRLIYNGVLAVAAAMIIFIELLSAGVASLLPMIVGAAAGVLVVAGVAAVHHSDIAGGDVKLMGLLGLVLGVEGVAWAFLLGACVAFAWYARRIAARERFVVPWAPFAASGMLLWVLVVHRVVG